MPNQIHGHDVIEMMVTSRQAYSRESLRAAIVDRFGADARFHTCSADNMDAVALIEFLAQRGKFMGDANGFTIDPERVCRH